MRKCTQAAILATDFFLSLRRGVELGSQHSAGGWGKQELKAAGMERAETAAAGSKGCVSFKLKALCSSRAGTGDWGIFVHVTLEPLAVQHSVFRLA